MQSISRGIVGAWLLSSICLFGDLVVLSTIRHKGVLGFRGLGLLGVFMLGGIWCKKFYGGLL